MTTGSALLCEREGILEMNNLDMIPIAAALYAFNVPLEYNEWLDRQRREVQRGQRYSSSSGPLSWRRVSLIDVHTQYMLSLVARQCLIEAPLLANNNVCR